ncbi:ribokinase [Virgibacillus sp. W0181]|uniref:ribokinase n=1 Tax=Virgibacillus sp. W0181 TaxID=3391581 RepID=UPI003F481683
MLQNDRNNKPNIIVIGSFMMDLIVRTSRFPNVGETIIGNNFSRFPGGKGANQAVAASRLGGQVTMAGKLGDDEFGKEFQQTLTEHGVNTDYVLYDSCAPTGIGSISLDAEGDNKIIVVPGANMQYNVDDLKRLETLIDGMDIMVLQLEMDLNVVEAAVMIAKDKDIPVILNPAPATELSAKLLSHVTFLTPNESEAELLTGVPIHHLKDAERAGQKLLDLGVKHVVITLGENGAALIDKTGMHHVPGFPTNVVDTVAAGDSFNGALAVALAKGESLKDAVEFANCAGALAVTKVGAIPSIPELKDVKKLLSANVSTS